MYVTMALLYSTGGPEGMWETKRIFVPHITSDMTYEEQDKEAREYFYNELDEDDVTGAYLFWGTKFTAQEEEDE